jgi:hypothetical protein
MKVDLKKVRSSVQAKKKARLASRSARSKTGATDVIRPLVTELQRMHDGGAQWSEIAAALGEQGVVDGGGKPITGRRLTALMHNIEKGAKKAKHGPEMPWPAPAAPKPKGQAGKVTLAVEMTRQTGPKPPTAAPLSERDLRLADIEKHAHLLKRR